MVPLPQVYVTLSNFGPPVYLFGFIAPTIIDFPIFLFWAYLTKVIPETRGGH